MLARSRVKTWKAKANAIVERFDEVAYRDIVAREVIVDWRGLTPERLEKLILLEKYPETEVPYSVEDAVWLWKQILPYPNGRHPQLQMLPPFTEC